MGNVGGLVAGLYTSDYQLIGRSLHDEIVERCVGNSSLISSLLKNQLWKTALWVAVFRVRDRLFWR
jgi:hypothetical protein